MVKTTSKTKKPTTRKPAVKREAPASTPRKHGESFRAARKAKVVPAASAAKPARRSSRPPAIVLDPDVRLYFPDSDAVNRALRQLIRLIPRRRDAEKSE
jgi:hypothetical protein